MNPLRELHTMIESLLFRMGDEQIVEPARADLTLIFRDGSVMNYGFQLTQPNDAPLSITTTIDEGDDAR